MNAWRASAKHVGRTAATRLRASLFNRRLTQLPGKVAPLTAAKHDEKLKVLISIKFSLSFLDVRPQLIVLIRTINSKMNPAVARGANRPNVKRMVQAAIRQPVYMVRLKIRASIALSTKGSRLVAEFAMPPEPAQAHSALPASSAGR